MIKQIEKILPRSAWADMVINECGEPLVPVPEMPKLKLGLLEKEYEATFLVREGLLARLVLASERLPYNTCLVLIEGWRSMEHQKRSWDSKWAIYKKDHPGWSDEEIDKKVRLIVARPSTLANHHCGGAVDVTLAYKDTGELLYMGTPYPHDEIGTEWPKLFPMHADGILPPQKENRRILREVMQSAGFVYYPGEWWHCCFGDRMYSVYTNRKDCIYGPIEPEQEN